MAGIADFLDSLVGGLDLICFCLAIGSLLWGLCLLRPWQQASFNTQGQIKGVISAAIINQAVVGIYSGAFWLAGVQLFKVILKIWLMTAVLERWPFPEFAYTTQFIGGLVRASLTLLLALYAYHVLKQQPNSKQQWLLTVAIALPMLISGAWLVHAAGRFEDQAMLMSLTVAHQIAAAIWIGGIFQLLYVWRHSKQQPLPVWPLVLKRFSKLGIGAVALLLLTGLPIALYYIDTWNGFVGTGYGNLLLVKIILLSLALGLAWLNRRGVQHYQLTGDAVPLIRRVPFYIEAETVLLCALLFTAASLASQPPASDIPELTASWQEVLHTFTPRIPRTSSPTHQALLAGEPGRVAIVGQVPSPAATAWSDYNHNIAGIFLTVMSFLAMLSYWHWQQRDSLTTNGGWQISAQHLAHYWPVGFIALGVFLFFRSDAETWPLGPIGFWESTFNNGEVLQHRIATFLVFILGVLEVRARSSQETQHYLPYVFPVLAAFGGLMLLTHSHVGFQPKSAFLIQVGHTLMGIFALVLACGRWLELKLDRPGQALAGFVSVAALFQIGIILMFYREPLY